MFVNYVSQFANQFLSQSGINLSLISNIVIILSVNSTC